MRKEKTINYFKIWSKTGTCYTQTINLKQKTFDKLRDCLRTELILKNWIDDNYYKEMYLKTPLEFNKKCIFMNLTQRDFFNKYLKLNLKDRNTCFYIID